MKYSFKKDCATFTLYSIIIVTAKAQTETSISECDKHSAYQQCEGDEYLSETNARHILFESNDSEGYMVPAEINLKIQEQRRRKRSKRSTELFSNKYFFSRNALPLQWNESYGSCSYLGGNFEESIGHNLSGGVSVSYPFYAAIKLAGIGGNINYSIPLGRKANISLGTSAGIGMFAPDTHFFALGFIHPFGCLTLGDRKYNISFSAAYGAVFTTLGNIGMVNYSISGMAKIHKKTSFVFDSFIMPPNHYEEPGALLIAGVRRKYAKDCAYQVGVAMAASAGTLQVIPIPYIQVFMKM